MMPRVFGLGFDFEIVYRVIRFIFIYVVNLFFVFKQSVNFVFHEYAVKWIQALCVSFWVRWFGSAIPVATTLANRDDFEHVLMLTTNAGSWIRTNVL